MTYIKKFRLKDRELEHKLNEISDGDFSASLNDDAFAIASARPDFELPELIGADFGERLDCGYYRHQIVLHRDEIEFYEYEGAKE